MNRIIIELLSRNVKNPTNNYDLDFGLTLKPFRSSVQTSTGFTPYFLFYGKEMRLPLDVFNGSPNEEQSRMEYATDVKKTLERLCELARQ